MQSFADIICEWPLARRLVGLSAVNALVGCLGCFLPLGERVFCGDYDDDDEVLMTKEGEKETGWRANKERIWQQITTVYSSRLSICTWKNLLQCYDRFLSLMHSNH